MWTWADMGRMVALGTTPRKITTAIPETSLREGI
jgi:hypothetical protein